MKFRLVITLAVLVLLVVNPVTLKATLIIAVWVAGGVPLESALGLFSFFFSDRLICFNISSAPVSPGTALDCSSALAAAGDI